MSHVIGEVTTRYFPEGSLLNRMEISVVEFEKRASEYLKDPYIVYLVESRVTDPSEAFEPGCTLWRRYSEFELLRKHLATSYPYLVMPVLPEKRLNVAKLQIATDKFDEDFLERRRLGLECFLLRLASHPVISQDVLFRGFLNQTEGWKDSVGGGEWKEKLDERLRTMVTTVSISVAGLPRDERFEQVHSYACALHNNITSVLKVQNKVCARMMGLVSTHAQYGTLFTEWSEVERENCDTLKQVAYHMDLLSHHTGEQLKTEELAYVDQLKEYLLLTDSLKNIAQKHETLQHNLSKLDHALTLKTKQKEDLIRDIQSMEEEQDEEEEEEEEEGEAREDEPPLSPRKLNALLHRVFGVDTLDNKRARLLRVDEEEREAEHLVREAEQDVSEFVEKSLKDLSRFHKQKVRDVSEILEHYVNTQININHLGRKQWKAMREAFMKL